MAVMRIRYIHGDGACCASCCSVVEAALQDGATTDDPRAIDRLVGSEACEDQDQPCVAAESHRWEAAAS